MSLDNRTVDQLIPIADQANASVAKLVAIAHKLDPQNQHLQEARAQLKLLVQASPLYLVKESQPYIWKYKEAINDRDEQTFLGLTLDEFVSTDSGEFDLQQDLMNILKSKFSVMSNEEKNIVWGELHSLMVAVIKFTIIQQRTPGMQ